MQDATIQLRRARLNLFSLLRLPPDSELRLVYPENLPYLTIDPERALSMAIAHNPEIWEHNQKLLESERDVERARKESRMNATLNASFGLNQKGNSIAETYRNPLDQEIIRLTLNIPILDWGLARGQYNLAKKNLDVMDATIQQARIDFDHNILLTVEEFSIQQERVNGAAQADTIAQQAFEIARTRFINGNISLTQLNAVQQNTIAARRAYISALESYWRYYYTIRRITLFDFQTNTPLVREFDETFGLR